MNTTQKAQRITLVAKWHNLHGWVCSYYANGEFVTNSFEQLGFPDLSAFNEADRRSVKRRLKKAFPEADSVFVTPVFSS